ncbi:hypothetical protein M0802_011253 [Mischocyttarus mexicanus]|nr:hypothetical protein M0802_011253 [Mischocyttarus mexicanus]
MLGNIGCMICVTITFGDNTNDIVESKIMRKNLSFDRTVSPAFRVPARNCPHGFRSDVTGRCRLIID